MNCENYAKLIDELIADELDDQTADQVSLHILDCQNCTAQFEILEREKQIYSHYLFEVEPPTHLAATFQTKLEAVPTPTILTINDSFISNILAFLRFKPALVTVMSLILLAVCFGLISLVKVEQSFETASATQNFQGFQMMLPPLKKDEVIAPKKAKKADDIVLKTKTEIIPKPIAIKQIIARQTDVKPKVLVVTNKINEAEQAQIKQVQTLEIETFKQLEKVELLLRSFRNARLIDGSEIYDIGYEQQQARKLLQTNVTLRQKSEIYGTLFMGEMLNKVEPYLLDIANLETNPTSAKVSEIKERVRNQNIIVSLQGF